jgi:hypothetical protein
VKATKDFFGRQVIALEDEMDMTSDGGSGQDAPVEVKMGRSQWIASTQHLTAYGGIRLDSPASFPSSSLAELWYVFNEGFSNAVRKPLIMRDLWRRASGM